MSTETDTQHDEHGEPAIEKPIKGIGGWLGKLSYNFTPITPFKTRLWKWCALNGLRNWHKVSGGDAIGLNALPGQRLEYTPVKYIPADKREGGKPGWKAKGRDKVWSAGSEGKVLDYLYGKIPIVLLDDDDHVEAGWLKSRIGEALELGQHAPLMTNPKIQHYVNVPADALGDPEITDGDGTAVADGGVMSLAEFNANSALQLVDQGEWAEDNIIDLSSLEGDDGMRISHRKAKEWRGETADSEEIKRAEERGRQMEALGSGDAPITRWLLILAAMTLGAFAIAFLGPILLGGGGGGGGGSIIPSMSTLPMQALLSAVGGA